MNTRECAHIRWRLHKGGAGNSKEGRTGTCCSCDFKLKETPLSAFQRGTLGGFIMEGERDSSGAGQWGMGLLMQNPFLFEGRRERQKFGGPEG